VLGTHMLDLMRVFGGDVESCFARCFEKGKPVNRSHVYNGNEGIGPLAADTIDASYRFKNGINGFFASHRGHGNRFGLKVFGSKGVLEFQSGYLKTAWLLRDPAWSPGRTGAKWQPISSNGVGKPETRDTKHGSNHAAVLDLIEAIEKDRQPVSGVYDARAATEMIASVFESHRQGGPVTLPLKNRKNPLTLL
jgi:predicted dehydrogenase